MIIPGLDKAIPGMAVGDKKVVNVPCAEAYGEMNPDARQAVPRDQFPDNIPMEIAEVGEAEVTLDANHALAGKDLTFAIEMVGTHVCGNLLPWTEVSELKDNFYQKWMVIIAAIGVVVAITRLFVEVLL